MVGLSGVISRGGVCGGKLNLTAVSDIFSLILSIYLFLTIKKFTALGGVLRQLKCYEKLKF